MLETCQDSNGRSNAICHATYTVHSLPITHLTESCDTCYLRLCGKVCVMACRSAASVASSQGSPGSNAADTPHLDDYIGRHGSPQRMTSGGSLYTQDQGQDHSVSDAVERNSYQLSQQRSGLWGVESNPSRQPSIVARASSPPRRQQSQSSQLSGILRSASEESSKLRLDQGADPREDTRVDARAEPRVQSGHVRKSPTRAPSRLRESTTEEAEVQYAAPRRDAHQSPARDSSVEEEDRHQRPHEQNPRTSSRAAYGDDEEEQDERQTRRRHSPRGSQPGSQQKLKGSRPHQFHHTAEEYFSRARVREALSPHKGSPHTRPYPTRARILFLHDNCTLADEQEHDQEGGNSQRQHARHLGQGGAQVTHLHLEFFVFTAFSACIHDGQTSTERGCGIAWMHRVVALVVLLINTAEFGSHCHFSHLILRASLSSNAFHSIAISSYPKAHKLRCS